MIKKAFKKGKCWDFAPEYIEEVKAAPANPVYEASTLLLPKAKYDQLVDQNELDGVLELVVRDLDYQNRHNAAAAEPSSGSDVSDTDDTTTEEELPAPSQAKRSKKAPPAKKATSASAAAKLAKKQRTLYQKKVSEVFSRVQAKATAEAKAPEPESEPSSIGEDSPPLVPTPEAIPQTQPQKSTKVSVLGKMEADQLAWALRESSKLASQKASSKGMTMTSSEDCTSHPKRSNQLGPCACPGGCTNSILPERFICSDEDGCRKNVHHLCYIDWARRVGVEHEDGRAFCRYHCPGLKG